ncbi:MAG TPA: PDDEXK nuclease domain-containing protein [Opitutaceae bacterium]|nr:PDDEXK nuclease domain-containing protein [Opitutaceae bacterium]
MKKTAAKSKAAPSTLSTPAYASFVGGVSELLEAARRTSARTVNALMTATYWEVGRRIVEFEQRGKERAGYGKELLKRLAEDLTARHGRGFSVDNLENMRLLYAICGTKEISETLSRKFAQARPLPPSAEDISRTPTRKSETTSRNSLTPSILPTTLPFNVADVAQAFPLPWSHYVLLVRRSRSPEAFAFYHTEALRGGWSVRQLQRQIDSQFYERTALSRNKATMLTKGSKPEPGDAVSADEEIRHPLVLEFLGLRDEYAETDLEDGLVRHLETFLLELGNDFAFVGRQRRLRIDDEWYRVDLLFFHRRLRCLVIFDLKLGRFTHADAGQMHVYLNYAREHWVQPGENPPVGIILCSGKSEALVRYATEALPTKMLVREYLTALPDEKTLAAELEKTRRELEARSK